MQQSNHQSRAGRAQRMPQCNGSAVDVNFISIKAQLFLDCEILRGEGFIDFDQVNVVEREPGFLDGLLNSRNRAAAHELRLHSGDAPTHDASERLEIALLRGFERHDGDGCATIYNSSGVARRDGAEITE